MVGDSLKSHGSNSSSLMKPEFQLVGVWGACIAEGDVGLSTFGVTMALLGWLPLRLVDQFV